MGNDVILNGNELSFRLGDKTNRTISIEETLNNSIRANRGGNNPINVDSDPTVYSDVNPDDLIRMGHVINNLEVRFDAELRIADK